MLPIAVLLRIHTRLISWIALQLFDYNLIPKFGSTWVVVKIVQAS